MDTDRRRKAIKKLLLAKFMQESSKKLRNLQTSNSGILAGVNKILQHICCCLPAIHLAYQDCRDLALNHTGVYEPILSFLFLSLLYLEDSDFPFLSLYGAYF